MSSLSAVLYRHVVRETLIPLGIIVSTTCLAIVLPFISMHRHNRYSLLLAEPMELFRQSSQQVDLTKPHLWLFLAATLGFGAFSILCLPGRSYTGPRSYHTSFQPIYRDTGLVFYALSLLIQVPLLVIFPILGWYHDLVSLAACFVALGLLVSLFLFVKGLVAPSAGGRVITYNPLFDFYTGVELYPRIGRLLDLKQLINCRFGMWLWQLIILAALKTNYELFSNASSCNYRLAVNVALQSVYIAKFFYWESGYMQTIDIALDHLGYYVGWGCIVWVPLFYTFSSWSAVATAPDPSFSGTQALVHFVLGLSAIWLNYEVDAQRQRVRKAWQDGKSLTVWGRAARTLPVQYHDANGKKQSSILLVDGFWSWARHVNYLFELLAAFLWSAAVCNSGWHVFFYFVFLLVLLVHRAHRDELKCAIKYGHHWQHYCRLVPYRIVPFIY